MKAQELIDMIDRGVLPVVRFHKRVEDWEGYFDHNMKAQAVSWEQDGPETIKVTFYMKDWDDHNSKVEKCNYWDTGGRANLNARQAGFHPEKNNWKEDYWFDYENDLPFEVIDEL